MQSAGAYNLAALIPPLSFCDHMASHERPDLAEPAAKDRLSRGDADTLLWVRNYTVAIHSGQPPFDDPIRIYVPLLARPQIMHACLASAFCHLGVTRTLKML